MIGYLEGTIHHFESDGVLLLVGSVGYEVVLNPKLLETIMAEDSAGRIVSLYIYYHQTERQPKPVLIGFETLADREFFQMFITVSAIGPMKAVKAMTRSTGEIAGAIEKKDVTFLKGLTGIGKRTAEKIIATLHGKVEKFVSETSHKKDMGGEAFPIEMIDISRQVEDVLVGQLGHSTASAKRMIQEAFERNGNISTPEKLFDEIFLETK